VSDQFEARRGLSAIVLNGKVWIIGGTAGATQTKKIFSSANATQWTEESEQTYLGDAGKIETPA